MNAHHVLYRLRDDTDRLLYIGVTLNLPYRLASHRSLKEWWGDVRRIDIEHFPTRGHLLSAEERAIRNERPMYNIIYNMPITPKPAVKHSAPRRSVTWRLPCELVDAVQVRAIANGESVTALVERCLDNELRLAGRLDADLHAPWS